MIIIDRAQSSNTISFIPSSYNPTGSNIFKITMIDESKNTQLFTQTVSSFSANDYYYQYTGAFGQDQNADTILTLEITDTSSGEVLCRDKILSTNQTATAYSLNNNKFTTNTTANNDFLVYE